jgi:type IV pilus assembly protein PilM
MNKARSIFSFKSIALRPRLACEITPSGVVAARLGTSDQEIFSAFAHLPPGSFTSGLKTPLFHDRGAVSSAIRQAVDEVAQRDTKITAIVPDASVRVLLLDFDSLPSKAADIPPIVRFRLRKLLPFEVDDTAVSYQTMPSSSDGLIRLLVAVSPSSVISEYESVVREAGYDPGAVLPSTLAALGTLGDDEPSLVVNRNGNSVTTAIARQNELLLHRTLEFADSRVDDSLFDDSLFDDPAFADSGFANSRSAEERRVVTEQRGEALEELRQLVSVAIAYFEDTLSTPPRQLLCCGLGGADDLTRLLGDASIPARDLAPAVGNATSMSRGILAGVLGALAN